MAETELSSKASTGRQSTTAWNIAALVLAVVAASGSLDLSLGLGLKACPLCFYQRSFAITAVLATAMLVWLDGFCSPRASLVALPLAVSGLGVATFHVYLVQAGKLKCPSALFGWGDGPMQSLAVFSALSFVCIAGAWSSRRAGGGGGTLAALAAVLLGAVTAWACIASAPSLPSPPDQPYDSVKQPFDMCRPPFSGA